MKIRTSTFFSLLSYMFLLGACGTIDERPSAEPVHESTVHESMTSTVKVFTYNPEHGNRVSMCAGVYIGDGLVLTAGHCVSDAADNPNLAVGVASRSQDRLGLYTEARVKYVEMKTRGKYPHRDLALVTVEKEAPRRPGHDALSVETAELRCESPVPVGTEVYAIGHPGYLNWFVTYGHVASTGRWTGSPEGFEPSDYWLQLDLTIIPGNSGGPVFDSDGRIVGIISHFMTTGTFRTPTGHSHAVSSKAVCALLSTYE